MLFLVIIEGILFLLIYVLSISLFYLNNLIFFDASGDNSCKDCASYVQ